MVTRLLGSIFLFAMLMPSLPATALFVASDFVITIEGFDDGPPDPNINGFGPGYNVWLTNVGDETAIFRTNIRYTGSNIEASLDGEDVFQSDLFDHIFHAMEPFPSDATVAPGETIYFGGFAMAFHFFDMPSVSTVTIDEFTLCFRNSPDIGPADFCTTYSGPPVSNTLTTPIPAVGWSLLPILLIVRRLLR